MTQMVSDGSQNGSVPTRRSIRRDGDFVLIRIPVSEVHTLRVCLHPCPCVAPKSNATLDYAKRIDRGLARLEAGNG